METTASKAAEVLNNIGPTPYSAHGRMIKMDIFKGKRQTIARVDDAGILAEGYAERITTLLAAAPDLLAACVGIIAHIEQRGQEGFISPSEQAVRDAIAKATGE